MDKEMKVKPASRQSAKKQNLKGGAMLTNVGLIQDVLGEIHRNAQEMPAEEFFEHLDDLVENSRRFIETFDDDETRRRLREVYRGIIRYALDCKINPTAAVKPEEVA
jgi:pantothenate kinase type III